MTSKYLKWESVERHIQHGPKRLQAIVLEAVLDSYCAQIFKTPDEDYALTITQRAAPHSGIRETAVLIRFFDRESSAKASAQAWVNQNVDASD